MLIWLDNTELDFDNNPDDLDSNAPELRAVLNLEGKVKIGNKIYFFNRQSNGRSLHECFRNRSEVWDQQYNGGNNQWSIKTEADSWPHLIKLHCRVCNFERRNNGRWRRSRTNIAAQVGGALRVNVDGESSCFFWKGMGATEDYRRTRCRHVRVREWGPSSWATFQDNEVCGTGNMNSGQQFQTVCIDHHN